MSDRQAHSFRASRGIKLTKPAPLKQLTEMKASSGMSVRRASRGLKLTKPAPLKQPNEVIAPSSSPAYRHGDASSVLVAPPSQQPPSVPVTSSSHQPSLVPVTSNNQPPMVAQADGVPERRPIRRASTRSVLKLSKPPPLKSATVEEKLKDTLKAPAQVNPTDREKPEEFIKTSYTSQVSQDSGIADMGGSYSRQSSLMDGVGSSSSTSRRSSHQDDLDWGDVDEGRVFTLGIKQLQSTSFYVNQVQPFNSLVVDDVKSSGKTSQYNTTQRKRSLDDMMQRKRSLDKTTQRKPSLDNATQRKLAQDYATQRKLAIDDVTLRSFNKTEPKADTTWNQRRRSDHSNYCTSSAGTYRLVDGKGHDPDGTPLAGTPIPGTPVLGMKKSWNQSQETTTAGSQNETEIMKTVDKTNNAEVQNGGDLSLRSVNHKLNRFLQSEIVSQGEKRQTCETDENDVFHEIVSQQSIDYPIGKSGIDSKPNRDSENSKFNGPCDRHDSLDRNNNDETSKIIEDGNTLLGEPDLEEDFGRVSKSMDYRRSIEADTSGSISRSSTSVDTDDVSSCEESFNEQAYAWGLIDDLSERVKHLVIEKDQVSEDVESSEKLTDNSLDVDDVNEQTYAWGLIDDLSERVNHLGIEKDQVTEDSESSEKLTDNSLNIDDIEEELAALDNIIVGKKEYSIIDEFKCDTNENGDNSVFVQRQPLAPTSLREEFERVERGEQQDGLYSAKGRRSMFLSYKTCTELAGALSRDKRIVYGPDELLEIGSSSDSHATPDSWSYLSIIHPDVCLPQVKKYFDAKRYQEERGYVVEVCCVIGGKTAAPGKLGRQESADAATSKSKSGGFGRPSLQKYHSDGGNQSRTDYHNHQKPAFAANKVSFGTDNQSKPARPRGFGVPPEQSAGPRGFIVPPEPRAGMGFGTQHQSDNHNVRRGTSLDARYQPVPSAAGGDQFHMQASEVDLNSKCDVRVTCNRDGVSIMSAMASTLKPLPSFRGIRRSLSDPDGSQVKSDQYGEQPFHSGDFNRNNSAFAHGRSSYTPGSATYVRHTRGNYSSSDESEDAATGFYVNKAIPKVCPW